MEARLHTATSSAEVYSMISVQRLLDLMVPDFSGWIFDWQHPCTKYKEYLFLFVESRMANHNS